MDDAHRWLVVDLVRRVTSTNSGGVVWATEVGEEKSAPPMANKHDPGEKKRPERTGFSLHKGNIGSLGYIVRYAKFQRVSVLSDVGSFGQNRF